MKNILTELFTAISFWHSNIEVNKIWDFLLLKKPPRKLQRSKKMSKQEK